MHLDPSCFAGLINKFGYFQSLLKRESHEAQHGFRNLSYTPLSGFLQRCRDPRLLLERSRRLRKRKRDW